MTSIARLKTTWRRRILRLASAVEKGDVESSWAVGEARALYEQALRWHVYDHLAQEGETGTSAGKKARAERSMPEYLGFVESELRSQGRVGAVYLAALKGCRGRDEEDVTKSAAEHLGFLGGSLGGRARARKLTPERRREIAQKAAAARWGKA